MYYLSSYVYIEIYSRYIYISRRYTPLKIYVYIYFKWHINDISDHLNRLNNYFKSQIINATFISAECKLPLSMRSRKLCESHTLHEMYSSRRIVPDNKIPIRFGSEHFRVEKFAYQKFVWYIYFIIYLFRLFWILDNI